ncbi:MAG: hypothetical protein DHS20C18_15000 [Saprospiraceae bacterium]|nr:MAG: hypothetical protein DHS20C18_15000 [Saprospiraceae bacterium]
MMGLKYWLSILSTFFFLQPESHDHLLIAPGEFVSVGVDTLPAYWQTEYPFLNLDANEVVFPEQLASFFEKLRQLENGEIERLNIVHIGDSHVQADFWTGKMRQKFQARFGAAGRGLIFPYQLAGTNNPLDYRITSNTDWIARNNAFKPGFPMGISGMSIHTTKPDFTMEVLIKDSLGDGRFNKVTFFNEKTTSSLDFALSFGDPQPKEEKPVTVQRKIHRVRSGDTLYDLGRKYGVRVKDLQRWNGIRGSRLSIGQKLVVKGGTVKRAKPKVNHNKLGLLSNSEYPIFEGPNALEFDTLLYRLQIQGERHNNEQKEALIYGISLENTRNNGIVYHSIGVNGATHFHFNQAKHFAKDLPWLEPDLIIVSLGTNESVGSDPDLHKFAEDVDLFYQNIADNCPDVPVLVTTNSDILRKRKYPNEGTKPIKEALVQKAGESGFGLWDLHELMGGQGAIRAWQKAGLAHTDFIHFTEAGYTLQADLLFAALIKAYEQY